MDATEVKRRRGTSSQCDGMIPADGEIIVDQTYNRTRVGDAILIGGHHQASVLDVQAQRVNYAAAGGTGNALTVSFYPALTAYVTGMAIEFRATANNTGAATINVDGLGTRTIQKFASGALAGLDAGDLISGVTYRATYNGSTFQLIGAGSASSLGSGVVAQANLKTSTGTFSLLANGNIVTGLWFSVADVVSPGGEYGFITSVTSATAGGARAGFIQGKTSTNAGNRLLSFSSVETAVFGEQRYVASSPPFNLGDGEVGGFIFLLRESNGDISAHYAADVPPWGYNGPTDIRASHVCPATGKKFRKVVKNRNFEQLMDGAPLQYKLEEITDEIKNRDMKLIPHPFGQVPDGHKVVMLDPMCNKTARMIELINSGFSKEVSEKIGKHLNIDNECLQRKCPKGVHVSRVRFK